MSNNQATNTGARAWMLVISVVTGLMAIAVMSLLFATEGSWPGAFLLDRHTQNFPYPFTVQNLMWLMFCVGCGELWVRYSHSGQELAQLSKRYLPEDETTMLRAEDLGSIYKRMRTLEGERGFFLQRLARRCILQFQASRSLSQSNALLNSSLELFQHELELRYTLLRYLAWLIPTMGFIGTVIGIAFALNYAAGVDNPQDPALLKEITGRLGVAFYTTLLALLQSALLVFILHLVQAREELALNRAGQYCLDNLINRLYEK